MPSSSEGASLLSESLTYIFNLSIDTCRFLQQWKIATVIPLFKQRGDRQSPSNCRPVSLLPAVGKIMEKLQSEALLSHLVDNKLISAHQFGFLPNRQCSWCIFLKFGCIPWKTARAQLPSLWTIIKLLIEFGTRFHGHFSDFATKSFTAEGDRQANTQNTRHKTLDK